MRLASQAQAANPTSAGMQLTHHAVTDMPVGGRQGSNLLDRAAVLVAHDYRRAVGELVGLDMQVGTANAAVLDLDQDFIGFGLLNWHLADANIALARGVFYQCAHIVLL